MLSQAEECCKVLWCKMCCRALLLPMEGLLIEQYSCEYATGADVHAAPVCCCCSEVSCCLCCQPTQAAARKSGVKATYFPRFSALYIVLRAADNDSAEQPGHKMQQSRAHNGIIRTQTPQSGLINCL